METALVATFCLVAPVFVRLPAARAAVAVGGAAVADELIRGLRAGGLAGDIADPCMQAVLALHDDRVLDAGRLVNEALAAEATLVWIELEPDLLELAGVVASRCGDHERALVLLGAGETARIATNAGLRQRDQQRWVEDLVEQATAHLGDAATAARERGALMPTADALAYARRGSGARKRPALGWDSLTPTELRVAQLVADGLTNPQIAERLLVTRATAKTHVSRVALPHQARHEHAQRVGRRSDPPQRLSDHSPPPALRSRCDLSATCRADRPSRSAHTTGGNPSPTRRAAWRRRHRHQRRRAAPRHSAPRPRDRSRSTSAARPGRRLEACRRVPHGRSTRVGRPGEQWCVMIGSDIDDDSSFLSDDVGRALWPDLDMVIAGWVCRSGRPSGWTAGSSSTSLELREWLHPHRCHCR
jgi:DNA-binding CsgD family transcriptional regulator